MADVQKDTDVRARQDDLVFEVARTSRRDVGTRAYRGGARGLRGGACSRLVRRASGPEHEVAEGSLAQLDFTADCRSQGGMTELEQRAAVAPDDLDTGYALAICLAGEGRHERALEAFLSIVERDKKYREGAAKDAVLRVFSIVGKRSDLADQYRSRLASVLY